MTVGLTRPEGHEIARRLVTMSDVIVENNRA
jgi:crotonobetainyl-CoA:carnitine CoA-transferase CaiB-like acyl-CoA transferase